MYARLLDAAGYHTSVKTVTNRELYEPALEKGQIDVVPEYAATIAEFLNAKVNGAKSRPVASPDADATVAALRQARRRPRPQGAGRRQGGRPERLRGRPSRSPRSTTSRPSATWARPACKVRLAAGDECPARPFCEPGLKKIYGIDVTGIDPKGVGTPQAKQAVKNGEDQLVLTTTTDATLDDFGLVLLDRRQEAPERRLRPAGGERRERRNARGRQRAGPAVEGADHRGPDRARTSKVDSKREKPADVAAYYLKSKGLLTG